MNLYRFEDHTTTAGVSVYPVIVEVVRETPCGYWCRDPRRWVSKTAKKRYAYPTEQEAIISFLTRKSRQYVILKRKLDDCYRAYDKGKVIQMVITNEANEKSKALSR